MADRDRLPFDPIAEARRQWERHGWSEAAPAMAVVTSIMRVQQIFLARADAVLRPFGLTFARYEVLMLLSFSRTGALPLGKIGQRLQVNPASVTNAIDRLEDGGLVSRGPNPSDGRGTLAHLTEQGRQLAAQATAAMNGDVFDDIGLQASELAAVWSLLAGLRRDAGDFDPPAPASETPAFRAAAVEATSTTSSSAAASAATPADMTIGEVVGTAGQMTPGTTAHAPCAPGVG